MNTDRYWAACTLAGRWRCGYAPRGINLLSSMPRFPQVRKGIYVAVDRASVIAYVGKVSRPGDTLAVRTRVAEHVVEPMKADHWARLYVIPLMNATPDTVVSYIEGAVIAALQPYQNRCRPDVDRLLALAGPHLEDVA